MRKLVALSVVLAASLAVLAPAASQEEQAGMNGFVTDVSGATVLIEEDPLESSGSDKASVEQPTKS